MKDSYSRCFVASTVDLEFYILTLWRWWLVKAEYLVKDYSEIKFCFFYSHSFLWKLQYNPMMRYYHMCLSASLDVYSLTIATNKPSLYAFKSLQIVYIPCGLNATVQSFFTVRDRRLNITLNNSFWHNDDQTSKYKILCIDLI